MHQDEQIRSGWFWFGALALVTVPLSVAALVNLIFG